MEGRGKGERERRKGGRERGERRERVKGRIRVKKFEKKGEKRWDNEKNG